MVCRVRRRRRGGRRRSLRGARRGWSGRADHLQHRGRDAAGPLTGRRDAGVSPRRLAAGLDAGHGVGHEPAERRGAPGRAAARSRRAAAGGVVGRWAVARGGGRRRLYRSSAPPAPSDARPVPAAERAAAESALAVLLGSPAFARVVPCAEPGALCVAGDTGAPGPLARDARDAARWGDDSVMFFRGDVVEIRPLGPGRARRLDWEAVPRRPRQMTVFLGTGRRPGGQL